MRAELPVHVQLLCNLYSDAAPVGGCCGILVGEEEEAEGLLLLWLPSPLLLQLPDYYCLLHRWNSHSHSSWAVTVVMTLEVMFCQCHGGMAVLWEGLAGGCSQIHALDGCPLLNIYPIVHLEKALYRRCAAMEVIHSSVVFHCVFLPCPSGRIPWRPAVSWYSACAVGGGRTLCSDVLFTGMEERLGRREAEEKGGGAGPL